MERLNVAIEHLVQARREVDAGRPHVAIVDVRLAVQAAFDAFMELAVMVKK